MPWRTQPGISEERQRLLTERRAIQADTKKGIYPFKGVKLNRADVEWLLATHESEGRVGPIDADDEDHKNRQGLDLRGARLSKEDLSLLPLARVVCGLALGRLFLETSAVGKKPPFDRTNAVPADSLAAAAAHLDEVRFDFSDLSEAVLNGAILNRASLRNTWLNQTSFEHASLAGAHLEGAAAVDASFLQADMRYVHFSSDSSLIGVRLDSGWDTYPSAIRNRRNLLRAIGTAVTFILAAITACTILVILAITSPSKAPRSPAPTSHEAVLNIPLVVLFLMMTVGFWAYLAMIRRLEDRQKQKFTPRLLGVRWDGVALESDDISAIRQLGDDVEAARRQTEQGAKKSSLERLVDFQVAEQANRQMVMYLRSQGLSEHADRFAYRAQVWQKRMLLRQFRIAQYLGSLLLDLISGYGYRPIRSFVTYVLVIVAFAALYVTLGGANGQALSWNEAIVVSMTAFHGRGFFAAAFQPGDPQAAVAAVEAFVGLLIEVVFIATFSQRLFSR
jgi:uncharacterized protein YjbI with pentapeptide repeats